MHTILTAILAISPEIIHKTNQMSIWPCVCPSVQGQHLNKRSK